MIIGAYQFAVTGNIKSNMEIIKKAILQAAYKNVRPHRQRCMISQGVC